MIIYPAIDLRHGLCVRLRQGRDEDQMVHDRDPAAVARRWVSQGAEWLHVVNLDGALGDVDSGTSGEALPINLQRLQQIRAAVPATPIQFGGGLRTLADVETALRLGATRVVLGTAAVRNPGLVEAVVSGLGAERIVVGIDAREGWVATHGWQQGSEWTAVALGRRMVGLGLVRTVYTDIARDGMLTGVNVAATAELARGTGLGVIASGGVASLDDIVQLKTHEAAGIEGVIIGQALYTGAVSLPEALRVAVAETALGDGRRSESEEKPC